MESTSSSSIEFIATSFRLPGSEVDEEAIEVSAILGVGTGLVYHQALIDPEETEADEESWGGYSITHLKSGRCLGYLTVETPRQARKWLELLSQVADWSQEFGKLAANQTDIKALVAAVEAARQQATELTLFVEQL